MTLPDSIAKALDILGAPYEMPGSEYLKQFVIAAAMGAEVPLRMKHLIDAQPARQVCVSDGELLLTEPETEGGEDEKSS